MTGELHIDSHDVDVACGVLWQSAENLVSAGRQLVGMGR